MGIVKCARPVSPVGRGVPEAWKVMGDDRRRHPVKFRAKGHHTVLSEMLCRCLAGRFDLPSMKPVLIVADAGPVEQINAVRNKGGLAPAGAGAHFAVKLTEPFLTAASLASAGVDLTADKMYNLDAVPGIPGFDTLVQNHDRHCDNTGVEPGAFGNGYSCRIFDFGHAFGGPCWTADSVKRACKALAPILAFCLIADRVEAPGDLGRFLRAFEPQLGRWPDGFVAGLPPELGPDARADAEALESALVALSRGALEEATLKAEVLRR